MSGHSTDFRRRAALYAAIDHRLATKTRFFLAASYTNLILHLLFFETTWRFSAARRQFRLSAATAGFLAALSHRLEAINMGHARRIANHGLTVQAQAQARGGLDACMVHMEQAAVQKEIDRLKLREPASYQPLVAELDCLLVPEQLPAYVLRLCRPVAVYDRALRSVTSRVGRPVTFARREDRHAIGLGLIDAIRGA